MDRGTMPVGFGMALAQNEKAMERFVAMTEAQRNAVLLHARQVRSRQEMQRLVYRLDREDGGRTEG